MVKPSIQFTKREDSVKIAYSKFGKGQPLVCPSPWVTSLSYIFEDPFARQFWGRLAQEVMVISYDKHGCGQSDRNRKDFTLETELLDLETVIRHLGLEEFNLLGSSMGGPVSIEYTARHPKRVRRLILYGTYARGKDLAKGEVRSALTSLIRASWGLGSKALAEMFYPEANTEELRSLAKFQRDSASPEIAAKLLELCFSLDVSELLSAINIPTLILHRDGDKVVTIDHGRQLAVDIPDARFKVLKGEIHPWWYGETTQIIEEISEFIGRGESEGPVIDSSDVMTKKDRVGDGDEVFIDGSEIVEQATIVSPISFHLQT